MKKIVLFTVLALGLLSFNVDSNTRTNEQENTVSACKYGQCKGTAKSTGKQCKHCVSKSGDSYCYQHK